MTLQELEQYLRGNYDTWTAYDQRVNDAAQGLLGEEGLNGLSLQDLRLSQDLAHVPGSGSGGEATADRRRDAMNNAWFTLQQSGQPLYQVIDGQRVYMNTGFGYVDGDYVVNPGQDAPIGTYSVAGQKRGDGLTDVMLPIMAGLAAGPLAGAAAGALEGGGGPGLGDLLDFYEYQQNQPSGPGQTFADSQGNPAGGAPPLPEHPVQGVLDAIEGLIGGADGIKIPIPGLPFPIPGNLTWEQLMDMAAEAGKSVWEILSDIGSDDDAQSPTPGQPTAPGSGGQPPSSGGQQAPVPEEGQGNWWDLGWDWWEDEDNAPANPDRPWDGEQPPDPALPGAGAGAPGGAGSGGGAGLAFPFLLPLFMQDRDSGSTNYDLWGYQGPDTSWGYETPDYGTPVNRPLFDWERQPNQPIPVAPNTQPRNAFLTPAEKAMRRRQQIEGLLG